MRSRAFAHFVSKGSMRVGAGVTTGVDAACGRSDGAAIGQSGLHVGALCMKAGASYQMLAQHMAVSSVSGSTHGASAPSRMHDEPGLAEQLGKGRGISGRREVDLPWRVGGSPIIHKTDGSQ